MKGNGFKLPCLCLPDLLDGPEGFGGKRGTLRIDCSKTSSCRQRSTVFLSSRLWRSLYLFIFVSAMCHVYRLHIRSSQKCQNICIVDLRLKLKRETERDAVDHQRQKGIRKGGRKSASRASQEDRGGARTLFCLLDCSCLTDDYNPDTGLWRVCSPAFSPYSSLPHVLIHFLG